MPSDTFDAKDVETMVEPDSGKEKLIETMVDIPETKDNVHTIAQHKENLPNTALLLGDLDDKSNARSNILSTQQNISGSHSTDVETAGGIPEKETRCFQKFTKGQNDLPKKILWSP